MGAHDDDGDHCTQDQQVPKVPGIQRFALAMFKVIDGPVTYFREKVVLPYQARNTEKFYHRRFNRVPTVDQCDLEDPVCIYEADSQYRLDKMVDSNIVKILRQRKLECVAWEGPDAEVKCRKIMEDYEEAATNWFIKYGEMKTFKGAVEAYMKQKHRLIWERRNPDKILR